MKQKIDIFAFKRWQRVEDWTDESFQEDCYVDIRAYGKQDLMALDFKITVSVWSVSLLVGKAERTREVVLDGMKKVQDAFGDHDLIANVRLETYEGERYFHCPPTEK